MIPQWLNTSPSPVVCQNPTKNPPQKSRPSTSESIKTQNLHFLYNRNEVHRLTMVQGCQKIVWESRNIWIGFYHVFPIGFHVLYGLITPTKLGNFWRDKWSPIEHLGLIWSTRDCNWVSMTRWFKPWPSYSWSLEKHDSTLGFRGFQQIAKKNVEFIPIGLMYGNIRIYIYHIHQKSTKCR